MFGKIFMDYAYMMGKSFLEKGFVHLFPVFYSYFIKEYLLKVINSILAIFL